LSQLSVAGRISKTPTTTGTPAAGSVRGRAARTTAETARGHRSWTLRKLREVWLSPFEVRVTTFLSFFRHIKQHGGVARKLLNAGQPILGRVEAGLQHAQRNR